MDYLGPIETSHMTTPESSPDGVAEGHAVHSVKRVLVETWGCQMNVADSENMLAMLTRDNYVMTLSEQEADLVILNTCHIREKATHKILSRLGVLSLLKSQKPTLRIAVAGCVAQAEGKRLLNQSPAIDVLVGPGRISDLPSLLKQRQDTGKPAVAVGFHKREDHTGSATVHIEPAPAIVVPPNASGREEVSRYINIAQGCDNFCTFCVVPFTRGREVSKLPREIIAEVAAFVNSGAKEITLLGQNVNSYGQDLTTWDNADLETSASDSRFVALLKGVLSIPGLVRLRFTTSNPHDFTSDLAGLFAAHAELGRYIHLPVQSGNDRILEVMRRKVTVDQYRERIRWLRDIDREMAISTDLIVGFPGESDEEFEDTLRLVEEVQYSFIFCFKYSSRPNTAAARFRDQVPEAVKDSRLQRLNALQDSITLKQNLAEIGRQREILISYESKKQPGTFFGRTPQFRLVRVASPTNIVGRLVNVEITSAHKTALDARLI